MTLGPPIAPPVPPQRSRWGVVLAIGVIAGVVGYLAFSGISNALVYYLTPTELLAKPDPIGQHTRLGGVVKEGTLTCSDGYVQFTITDGTTEMAVSSLQNASLMCPREGVGVVVEGELNQHGVFRPNQVIVKHDENYVAPSEGQLPSQVIDPGT